MDIVYDMRKKGYNYPLKKNIPIARLLSSFGIIIISQISRFVNMYSEIYQITFREVEKSLPCVKGGGLRSKTEGL